MIRSCLLLCLCAHVTAFAIQVSGHVHYRDGNSVSDAKVKFWSYAGSASMLSQPETRTNENGFFRLTIEEPNPGAISASKEEDGYPDSVIGFYGRANSGSFRDINPKTLKSGTPIELRLGAPHNTLAWLIVDSSTKHVVKTARISVMSTRNPRLISSETIAQDGVFRFVLPHDSVRISISAPDYFGAVLIEDGKNAFPKQIGAPGTKDKRTIELQRRTK